TRRGAAGRRLRRRRAGARGTLRPARGGRLRGGPGRLRAAAPPGGLLREAPSPRPAGRAGAGARAAAGPRGRLVGRPAGGGGRGVGKAVLGGLLGAPPAGPPRGGRPVACRPEKSGQKPDAPSAGKGEEV